LRPPLNLAYAGLAAALVLAAVVNLTGRRTTALIAPIYVATEVIGLAFAVRAARHPRLSPAERRPWRFVAAWYLLEMVYGAALGAALDHDAAPGGLTRSLLIAIVVRLLDVPIMVTGLLAFAAEPLSRWGRRKLALDVATVIGAATMVIWYWVIGPGLYGRDAQDGLIRLAVVLLPVANLGLAVGLVTVLLRGVVTGARSSVALLAAGLASNVGFDGFLVWQSLIEPVVKASLWSDLLGLSPLILLDAAAIERCRKASERRRPELDAAPLRPYSFLPYVALAAGYTLLVVVAVRDHSFLWPGLVGGAVIMTGAVAARQVISLRENHLMAVTDSLTGLANRLLLRDRMTRALERSRRTGQAMALLLIDLDGFKQINDTHGHEAGDAVLVDFARILKRYVRATDTPARLGGDEFAVLLEGITDAQDAVEVAKRLLAGAREAPGVDGNPALRVGASIGIAVGDPRSRAGLVDPHKQLRQADQAMYVAKRARSTGWCMYTRELDEAVEHAAHDLEEREQEARPAPS
jgi:diguanylate cyclase (GGDEF)-like protein